MKITLIKKKILFGLNIVYTLKVTTPVLFMILTLAQNWHNFSRLIPFVALLFQGKKIATLH